MFSQQLLFNLKDENTKTKKKRIKYIPNFFTSCNIARKKKKKRNKIEEVIEIISKDIVNFFFFISESGKCSSLLTQKLLPRIYCV